jgi:hypothetical protein
LSAEIMKKASSRRTVRTSADELKREYRFDYRRSRPNRFIGVQGEELEDLLTMGNPRFWEMLEVRRRNAKTVSLAEVRRRLHLRVPKKRRRISDR